MHPSLVVALVLLVAAALVAWWASRAFMRWRLVVDTKRSRIGALRGGFAEIEGRVVAPERTVTAPMSGARCVWYRFIVEEQRTRTTGHGKNRRTRTEWVVVVGDTDGVPCIVDDGSGRALVELSQAELHLHEDARARSGFLQDAPPHLERLLRERYGRSTVGLVFNKSMRYRETVIEPGDSLYVLGTCVKGRDLPRFTAGHGDLFLVGDRGERAVASTLRAQAVGRFALAGLLLAAAIALPFLARAGAVRF